MFSDMTINYIKAI